MDEKSLISRSASDFAESPFSFLKGLFNDNSGALGGNVNQDALEAVKLDPAVLEAQVTVHSKDTAIDAANLKRRAEVFIEDTIERVPTPPTPAPPKPSQGLNGFKDMVLQQEAALLSLNPHQLEVLMKYADVLRRQRMITQRYLECAFCKNNGKPSFWYTSRRTHFGMFAAECGVQFYAGSAVPAVAPPVTRPTPSNTVQTCLQTRKAAVLENLLCKYIANNNRRNF